jgi:hypothetical protein
MSTSLSVARCFHDEHVTKPREARVTDEARDEDRLRSIKSVVGPNISARPVAMNDEANDSRSPDVGG